MVETSIGPFVSLNYMRVGRRPARIITSGEEITIFVGR